MKAFYAERYGGPEVMRYGELPDPRPGRGEALIAVEAASVNPVDYKIRGGMFRLLTGRSFPKVLGFDFAGVVRELGPGATGWRTGDAVYGFSILHLRQPGAHAELVPVAARRLRRRPAAISPEEAAALPVAGLTALHGLRQCGDLGGRRVLVNGATGGVGHFALQIAQARGAAVVTAVCRGRNAELAAGLGAHEILDHEREDFTRSGRQWDVIFDAHAGAGTEANLSQQIVNSDEVENTMPQESFGSQPLTPGNRLVNTAD